MAAQELRPLSQERLKDSLHYDPATGVFTRCKTCGPCVAGAVAGRDHESAPSRKYRRISVENKTYYAHHLAFLYMTGEFPAATVDHIDRNGLNNAWSNLRAATQIQNLWNQCRSNKSGFRGVDKAKCRRGKKIWRARVQAYGKVHNVGWFYTPEDAARARDVVAKKLHGEFALLNSLMERTTQT